MTLEIDGAAILSSVAANPAAFSMSRPEVNAIAADILRSKIREKGFSLEALRSLYQAISESDFKYLIDYLSEKEVKALAKLDSKHPEYKTATDQWYRSQIVKLAKREVEPTVKTKPVKAPRPAAVPRAARISKIGKIMNSEAQAVGTRSA